MADAVADHDRHAPDIARTGEPPGTSRDIAHGDRDPNLRLSGLRSQHHRVVGEFPHVGDRDVA